MFHFDHLHLTQRIALSITDQDNHIELLQSVTELCKRCLPLLKTKVSKSLTVVDNVSSDLDAILKDAIRPTVTVALFGKPGQGKSYFINQMLGLKVARSCLGEKLAQGVTYYPVMYEWYRDES